jgi:hypothetical protein
LPAIDRENGGQRESYFYRVFGKNGRKLDAVRCAAVGLPAFLVSPTVEGAIQTAKHVREVAARYRAEAGTTQDPRMAASSLKLASSLEALANARERARQDRADRKQS